MTKHGAGKQYEITDYDASSIVIDDITGAEYDMQDLRNQLYTIMRLARQGKFTPEELLYSGKPQKSELLVKYPSPLDIEDDKFKGRLIDQHFDERMAYTSACIRWSLKCLREEAGINRARIMKDTSIKGVADWERGKSTPNVEQLAIVVDYYSDLLGRKITLDEVACRNISPESAALAIKGATFGERLSNLRNICGYKDPNRIPYEYGIDRHQIKSWENDDVDKHSAARLVVMLDAYGETKGIDIPMNAML